MWTWVYTYIYMYVWAGPGQEPFPFTFPDSLAPLSVSICMPARVPPQGGSSPKYQRTREEGRGGEHIASTLNACNHKFTLIKRFGEQSSNTMSRKSVQTANWIHPLVIPWSWDIPRACLAFGNLIKYIYISGSAIVRCWKSVLFGKEEGRRRK